MKNFGTHTSTLLYKLRNQDTKPMSHSGIFTNISNCDNPQYSAIFDQSPIGIVLSTTSFEYLKVNEAFCKMLGYSKNELMNLTCKDITYKDDMPLRRKNIEDLYSGKVESYSMEIRYIKKDKTLVLSNLTESLVKNTVGKPLYSVGVIQYSENHKKVLETLKKSENQYRQLVELLPVGIGVHHKGKILFMNTSGTKLLGADDPKEIIGMDIIDLVDDEFKSVVKSRIDKLYKENKSVPLIHERLIKINGDTFDAEVTATPMIFERRNATQVFFRDITERKKTENQLINAKELAEDSKRIKEELLTNVSHEIRTPINILIGMTDILQETDLTSEQEEYVESMKLSANNLLVIINEILSLSRIEAGKIEYEETEFNLEELIGEILQTFRYKAREKDIMLSGSIDKRIPSNLIGDPVKIKQILLNLVANSIKFTETGIISIDVKLIDIDNEYVNLILSVSDTGIGIPENKLSIIFDSFTQANSDATREYGGTGLGLTIVQRLVAFLGGNITVESEEAHGTIFTINLSFRESQQKGLSSLTANTELKNLFGVNILLAEDNKMNQVILSKQLDNWGGNITIVENGKEVFTELEKNDYDIILMDIQMPVMDGFQATKTIRDNGSDKNRNIPILAVTAHASENEKTKALKLGMDGYISKPFDPKVLYNTIIRLLMQ